MRLEIAPVVVFDGMVLDEANPDVAIDAVGWVEKCVIFYISFKLFRVELVGKHGENRLEF